MNTVVVISELGTHNSEELAGTYPSSPYDFLLGCTREPDTGYNQAWHDRTSLLKLIDIDRYLAHSDSWQYMPSLKRYREIPKKDKQRVSEALGKYVGSALTHIGKASIICVEKPYLEGFTDGLKQTIGIPFVLLAVNGGDAPLTQELQDKIVELHHLKVCFANNLHVPRDTRLFLPMPIGVTAFNQKVQGEDFLHRIRESALPWEERDRRLLVPPMRITNRLRSQFLEVLSGPDYSPSVRLVSERLEREAFLQLLSQHQSVLSPPGRGYDCSRTWQAIAIGTVPLVVDDPKFDQRIHTPAGPQYIPSPEELSPAILREVLRGLSDPSQYAEQLSIGFWRNLWTSYLS